MSVEVDAIFLVYGGISGVTGWFTNQSTGEKCFYETTCKKLGVGVMLADVSGNGNMMFNGPKCGKDLAGTSVGMGLDVGPVALSASTDQNGVISLVGGGGIGPAPGSGGMNAMVCETTIKHCEKTPCECENH